MRYKINNDGIFEYVTHEEFAILKGIKPITKVIKHKMNTKDRKKVFPVYGGEDFKIYVYNFLKLNNLKVD